jgi:putative transposase
VKYEEVYLHAYESVPDARASIGRYLDLYNRRPPLIWPAQRRPNAIFLPSPSLLS